MSELVSHGVYPSQSEVDSLLDLHENSLTDINTSTKLDSGDEKKDQIQSESEIVTINDSFSLFF